MGRLVSRRDRLIQERRDAVEQGGAADVDDVGVAGAGDFDHGGRAREGPAQAPGVGQGDEGVLVPVDDQDRRGDPRGQVEGARAGQRDPGQRLGTAGDEPGEDARRGDAQAAEPAADRRLQVEIGRFEHQGGDPGIVARGAGGDGRSHRAAPGRRPQRGPDPTGQHIDPGAEVVRLAAAERRARALAPPVAALVMVLPKNVWQYVVQIPRLAQLGTRYVLQGGTQYNLAAVKAQVDYIKERVPGAQVFVHPHTGEAGALGAAFETLRVVKRRGSSRFIGLDAAIDLKYETKNDEETVCHFCPNECKRTFVDAYRPDGTTSRYIAGFSC